MSPLHVVTGAVSYSGEHIAASTSPIRARAGRGAGRRAHARHPCLAASGRRSRRSRILVCRRSRSRVRPSCFGGDGVLLNNIAWLLRRVPVVAIGGPGDHRLRPVHIADLAPVHRFRQPDRQVTVDVAGPEAVTVRQLVETIKTAAGNRAVLVPVPAAVSGPGHFR